MKNYTKIKKKYIYNRLLNEKYILRKFKKQISNYFPEGIVNRFVINYTISDTDGETHNIGYNDIRYFYFDDFFSNNELNSTDKNRFGYFDQIVTNKLVPAILENMLIVGGYEKILTLRACKNNKKLALSVINRSLWRMRGTSSNCIQIKCKLKRRN